MQGLVGRLHPGRRDPGSHRLDALALARQQQPGAVGPPRRGPARMAQHRHDRVQVGGESLLAGPRPFGSFLLLCHAPYMGRPRLNDTIKLSGGLALTLPAPPAGTGTVSPVRGFSAVRFGVSRTTTKAPK